MIGVWCFQKNFPAALTPQRGELVCCHKRNSVGVVSPSLCAPTQVWSICFVMEAGDEGRLLASNRKRGNLTFQFTQRRLSYVLLPPGCLGCESAPSLQVKKPKFFKFLEGIAEQLQPYAGKIQANCPISINHLSKPRTAEPIHNSITNTTSVYLQWHSP